MKPKTESIKHPTSARNLYRVPVKQWRRWSKLGRQVFNDLFSSMKGSPWVFSHPDVDKISPRRWKTTCWNAAWIAADSASRIPV